jgi:hypothetical protein
MKTFVLTVDYELFFGVDSGTVENCMIRPTKKLARLLGEYGGKMTLFWDILHYVRLCQLAGEVPGLMLDKELIENQIRQLVNEGHDLQMLLHPHWLDAEWDGYRWRFDYRRFALQNLSTAADENDINTILGCVTMARKTMEKLIIPLDAAYRVTTVRIGGHMIEPFGLLREAFLHNNITMDSSVIRKVNNRKSMFPYTFENVPDELVYRFDLSVEEPIDTGPFWEFPMETIRIPRLKRMWLAQIKQIGYIYPGRYGDGKGLGERRPFRETSLWGRIVRKRLKFTPENSFPEKWHYLTGQAQPYSVARVHSKNLSPLTLNMLEDSFHSGEVRFISIRDRFEQLSKQT